MGKKREIAEINASSMADIAFLLLVFFLVTTSMSTDLGLVRRLPPPVPKEQEDQKTDIKKRNILVVLINSHNQLMVRGEVIEISDLKEKAKEFIANPNDDENMPEKEVMNIDGIGNVPVTKNHVISLQNDRGTEFAAYISVQNELVAAYNELRNECALKNFNMPYDELEEEQQNAVKKIFPQNISEAEPKNYGGAQ